MTADTLSLLSVISFVLAGVCFAVAVFLWFFFKIPRVIGDLNGRTARKSIAKMREYNENSGTKTFNSSPTNLQRGKLTETIPENKVTSEKIKATPDDEYTVPMQVPETDRMSTERLETGVLEANQGIPAAGVTAALGGNSVAYAPETAPLNEPQTNETELLVGDLPPEAALSAPSSPSPVPLVMIEKVMLVHTNEVIPL